MQLLWPTALTNCPAYRAIPIGQRNPLRQAQKLQWPLLGFRPQGTLWLSDPPRMILVLRLLPAATAFAEATVLQRASSAPHVLRIKLHSHSACNQHPRCCQGGFTKSRHGHRILYSLTSITDPRLCSHVLGGLVFRRLASNVWLSTMLFGCAHSWSTISASRVAFLCLSMFDCRPLRRWIDPMTAQGQPAAQD